MESEIRSLRALVRRMKFTVPGLAILRAEGVSTEVLQTVAEAESLSLTGGGPAGLVIWAPGRSLGSIDAKDAIVVCVVAEDIAGEILPHLAAHGRASVYTTLRAWVKGWRVGSFLATFMNSDAVGSRLCRIKSPTDKEWIFTRQPIEKPANGRGETAKFLLVTGLGTGLFPIMPATVTSLCLLPFGLVLWWGCSYVAFVGIMLIILIASTWGCLALEKWAGRQFFAEDPREFVLDEVAGLTLAWALLPPGSPWWGVVLGFVLFRVFDIFKWGVHWIETVPIPGRIVWDDLIAGAYAGILSALILIFFR